MPATKKRKAAKSALTADTVSALQKADAEFGRLVKSLTGGSARAFKSAKRELESLRKQAKKHTSASARARTRLANAKAKAAKKDNAVNRKAVRVAQKELATVNGAKKATSKSLAGARETHASAKKLATKHKKYGAALGAADKALNRPVKKKKRAAKKD